MDARTGGHRKKMLRLKTKWIPGLSTRKLDTNTEQEEHKMVRSYFECKKMVCYYIREEMHMLPWRSCRISLKENSNFHNKMGKYRTN
jgi:hypothetical protein